MSVYPDRETSEQFGLGSTMFINRADWQVVEDVLGMGAGYVLDFSDRTFDQFFLDLGIAPNRPEYLTNGTSKANRLRTMFRHLDVEHQANVLRQLLEYRDVARVRNAVGVLDPDVRTHYEQIIEMLNAETESAAGDDRVEDSTDQTQTADEAEVLDEETVSSSQWTGRRDGLERLASLRALLPAAMAEIDGAIAEVERCRFNDPLTADALMLLRQLHDELGGLIEAIDGGLSTDRLLQKIEANRTGSSTLLLPGLSWPLSPPLGRSG